MMMMDQNGINFQTSFYPSPAWSSPSSETDYGSFCGSAAYIKNEPHSPEQSLINCLTPKSVNLNTVSPPPPPSSGYTPQMTNYAPLTPPYGYDSVHSPQSYWQTSSPPPYEEYFTADSQEQRKYTEVGSTQHLSDQKNSGCLDELSDESALEQLRAICLQEAAYQVKGACNRLNISPNPYSWDIQDVQRWVFWLIKEKKIDCSTEQLQMFCKVTGAQLISWCEKMLSMSQAQLASAQRALLEAISAHLDIWKSASQTMQQTRPEMEACIQAMTPANNNQQSFQYHQKSSSPKYSSVQSTSPLYSTDDSYSDDEESSAGSQGCSTQHIHLWQFLKELLSDAVQHGACIRWLDRGRGIFKIEDSVRVAKLWGRRKNRPAMNYDKLSRSIRQYYRKGIMKKTERSQRLVYQFCPAYAN